MKQIHEIAIEHKSHFLLKAIPRKNRSNSGGFIVIAGGKQ